MNRIFYHGACYSPDDAPWPGWLFYASTEMNPRNPIWRDVSALNEYIARCQAILQSGQPDNDVLLYWPVADFWSQPDGLLQPMSVGKTDWFGNQPIGKTAHELWDKGYAFDYVSDRQLLKAKVVDGKIQLPGCEYKIIIVPKCKYISLVTFEEFGLLAKAGATVFFENQLPEEVCGWWHFQEKRSELKDELAKIHFKNISGTGLAEAKVGHGKILVAANFATDDSHVGMERESGVDQGLSFCRRSFAGGWNYFIANRTVTNVDGWVSLARPAKSFIILDPVTGNSDVAATRQSAASKIEVHLQLAAGQSVILRAFADELDGRARHSVRAGAAAANERRARSDAPYLYWQTNGQPVAISGDWKIKFLDGGPVLPADFQTAQLASWTTFPDTNAQAFAGTAKYEITFDAPQRGGDAPVASSPPPSDEGVAATQLRRGVAATHFALNLGDVRQSARVRVNGKDYGTLITPPFRVVVDNLKPAGNTLAVEVTSVAANRIRDLDRRGVNWKVFKDINLVDQNYKPFDAADWPLTDCGLLGPVTLTPVTAK